MAISYSFHLSSKKHAVTNTNKVSEVSRHNLRQYASEHYDKNKIEILRGSDKSILDDVKRIYHEEFDAALARYNSGKRPDRVISDYLEHVSKSRNDVACEIIIQLGDRDFWDGKTLEERRQMSYIFSLQLESLEFLVPEFRIASAVVHYDESSPHMHVVGIPVAYGYKRGMEKQVAKTKIFTAERLGELQDKMRENAEYGMQLSRSRNLFSGTELKEKEKGRNKDIPKQSLAEYYALRQDINVANENLKETLIQKNIQEASIRQARLDASELYRQSVKRQVENKKLEKSIAEKRQKSSDLDKEISEAGEKLENLLQNQAELETCIANKESVIRQRNKILQAQDDEHRELEKKIDAQKKDLDTLDSQIAVKRDDLSVSELLSKMAEKKAAEFNRQSEYCQEKIEALKAQEQRLNYNIDYKRSKLDDLERLAGDAEQKLHDASKKVKALKEQEQSLNSQVERMRSDLAEAERLAGERQEELLAMAKISEDEMQMIKSDSISHNLVQKAIWATCEFLGEQGMLRSDNWRSAAVAANNPVLAQLKEPMTGFLQKVKEHMLKSIKTLAKKKRKGR